MIAEGTPSDLIDGISGTVVSFQLPAAVAVADAIATFGSVLDHEVEADDMAQHQ